jgi:major membrane immunogen (membrane-anchored lipoprotein)
MRRSILAPAVVVLALLLAGCGERESTSKDLAPTGSVEVMNKVYDDQQSTAYIRVNKVSTYEVDIGVADIMIKKKDWEKKFPDKKVVAMSIATGNSGGKGYPAIVGLLIHYENR